MLSTPFLDNIDRKIPNEHLASNEERGIVSYHFMHAT